jgi:hypothetical protein
MALFLGVMDYLDRFAFGWQISALTAFSFLQPLPVDRLTASGYQTLTLYQMVFNGSMLFGPSIRLLIPLSIPKAAFRDS